MKPRLRGRALAVRFADDAVLAFEREEDARRVLAMLGKRFGKYGLRLRPEKTGWWTSAARPGVRRAARSASGALRCCGPRNHWGRSRKGRWAVKRKTAKDRLIRAVRAIGEWCRRNRHLPMAAQWAALRRKLPKFGSTRCGGGIPR